MRLGTAVSDWSAMAVQTTMVGATRTLSSTWGALDAFEMHVTTGRRLRWDPKAERFTGDDAAHAMLARPQRVRYAI
ncbi:hypothetical protein LQ953_15560 [Sphingomonas sp. IC-56]|uniref:hypothetical protein n=1 Tax=Sphingomonas sp. IC-56 TaxID=2898529 RepID=UPI001E4144EB|nr:hypothetical protein [Sphingomonas sp. IC-56]MCD2325436.1 hypothetical protein [Sphingomonas sp. IC-56]